MSKGFDIASIIGNVSVSDTGREQIEYIDEAKLRGDDANFYALSGLEELAANIELIGLQQPLRVRPDPDDVGGYIVVSGHRRLAAIRTVLKPENPERWAEIPCIVERDEVSPAMRELRLIYANADTRKMTSADLATQVDRVRELLYQLQEEGVEFPGRMRDHVAEACKLSRTKIATLDVISRGLSKSKLIQSAWKKGTLSESVAYELAKLPRELQDEIAETYEEKCSGDYAKGLRYLYADCVKKIAGSLEKLDALCCDVNAQPCVECAGMKHQHLVSTFLRGTYNYAPCAEKCCEDCDNLGTCKDVCPLLKSKQEKMKADKRYAAKLEKEKQAERDAPKIKRIQELWNRFGEARNAADVSVEDAYKAMDVYFCKSDEQRVVQQECLEAKFTAESKLPYGYSCALTEVERYVKIADLFGVSLDYLLCRTDEPKTAAGKTLEADAAPAWRTGVPKRGGDYWCKFECSGAVIHQRARWESIIQRWTFSNGVTVDAKCLGWYPLPEDPND